MTKVFIYIIETSVNYVSLIQNYFLEHMTSTLSEGKNQEILSLFAQDKYGYDGKQYTDVKAFREGLNFIRQQIPVYWFDADNRPHKTTIALPYKIGCGRGGADWEVVYKIIEEELSSFEVELWKLEEQNV